MSKIILDANFDVLDEIRDFVADIAHQANFSDKEIYSIQLATDEACTNVIEHAYADFDEGKLEVECNILDGGIKIVIRDQGVSFDPSSVLEPNLKADLSDRKIGGLGIYLMRKLMDDVSYESSVETGNTLTMFKRKGNSD